MAVFGGAGEPVRTVVRPKDRRPRPKRWADAVGQLRTLQAEYEAWRDQLPESLADSRTAELLEGVCDLDLDALDVDLHDAAAGVRIPAHGDERRPVVCGLKLRIGWSWRARRARRRCRRGGGRRRGAGLCATVAAGVGLPAGDVRQALDAARAADRERRRTGDSSRITGAATSP